MILSRIRHRLSFAPPLFLAVLICAGLVMADGTRFSYQTSWIGNQFPTTNSLATQKNHERFMCMDTDNMFVAPNGRVYTVSVACEAGNEGTIISNGEVHNIVNSRDDFTSGLRLCGGAVTANSKYLYIATAAGYRDDQLNSVGLRRSAPSGTTWWCVRRMYLDGGRWASWNQGYGFNCDLLVVQQTANTVSDGDLLGLAVDNANNLYVSDTRDGEVRVYDAETMAYITAYTGLDHPRQLTVDDEGKLWVNEYGTKCIKRFDPPSGGTPGSLLTTITLAVSIDPTALAFNSKTGKLMVADNGPAQQIRYYTKAGAVSGTFGCSVYDASSGNANIGKVGDGRFWGLTGVGADAAGNIYVASDGMGPRLSDSNASGSVIECYAPTGKLKWQVNGMEFIDNGLIDPSNETSVYDNDAHYTLDYSKPQGQQWKLVGRTLNATKYPDDRRITKPGFVVNVQRINGTLYMAVSNMGCEYLALYRFNPTTDGEVAIPCADFDRGTGQVWVDLNGNGKKDASPTDTYFTTTLSMNRGVHFDADGDVWTSKDSSTNSLLFFQHQGFTSAGLPIYTTPTTFTPAPFTGTSSFVRRMYYDTVSDTLYLSGCTPSYPYQTANDNFGAMGKVIMRYPNWKRGGNRTADPNWIINPPQDWQYQNPDSWSCFIYTGWDVAGDYLFLQSMHQMDTRIYRLSDGVEITSGTNSRTGAVVSAGQTGVLKAFGLDYQIWTDIGEPIHAFKRANGEYIIFVEEDIFSKVLMYRWTPNTYAPPTPTNVKTSMNAASPNNSLVVSWTGNTDAAGYRIERQYLTANGWSTWTVIADNLPTTSTSYTDSNLAAGTKYNYRVYAIGPGLSSNSPESRDHVDSIPYTLMYNATSLQGNGDIAANRTLSTRNVGTEENGYGTYEVLPASAVGDYMTCTLRGVPAGQYNLWLQYANGSNYGTAQLQVDGVNFGSPINMRGNAGLGTPTLCVGTVTFTTAGSHTVKFNATVTGSIAFRYLRLEPIAPMLNSANFTANAASFEGDSLPTQANPAWGLQSGSESFASVESPFLHLNTTANVASQASWNATSKFGLAADTGWTAEMRLRVNSYVGGSTGIDQGYTWQVFDRYGTTHACLAQLDMSATQINVRGTGGGLFTKTLSDAYHTVRIVKRAASPTFDVYVDGTLLVSGVVNDMGNNFESINFGDKSTARGMNVDLDYLRVDNTGPYTPAQKASASFTANAASYEGSALPSQSAPYWGVTGSESFCTLENSFLHLDTTSAVTNLASWNITNRYGLSADTGWTAEARVRVNNYVGGATGQDLGYTWQVFDQSGSTHTCLAQLDMSATQINVRGTGGGLFNITLSDAYHAIRLVKRAGAPTYDVYVDGTLLVANVTNDLGTNFEKVAFGDNNNARGENIDLDYLRLDNTGPYAPDMP